MPMPIRILLAPALACSLCLAVLGGCAGGNRSVAIDPQTGRNANDVEAARLAEEQRLAELPPGLKAPEQVRDLKVFSGTGLEMTWSGLVARAAASDVVLIGELHGHPMGLDAAATLFDDLLELRPTTTALAMEFFERDEQLHLDDLMTGVIDHEQFMKTTGRESLQRYPEGHRRMVLAALERDRPIIAANAPRRYVRLARLEGFEHLETLFPAQQEQFVIPQNITQGDYKDRFFDLMGGMRGHSEEEVPEGEDDPMILSFFRSQNVWDATMADSIVRAHDAGSYPVVLVVGQFHTDHEGGTTSRVRELRPGARVMTVSVQPVWSLELREEDFNRADAVIYVGPSDE
ncbi:MAG: ChaN family lipoprotein [Phycisphaerales bacterium JB050]